MNIAVLNKSTCFAHFLLLLTNTEWERFVFSATSSSVPPSLFIHTHHCAIISTFFLATILTSWKMPWRQNNDSRTWCTRPRKKKPQQQQKRFVCESWFHSVEAAVLTDGSSFTEVPVCQRLLVVFLTFSVLPSQFTKRVRAGNGDLNNASHAIIFAVGNAFDDKRMLIARESACFQTFLVILTTVSTTVGLFCFPDSLVQAHRVPCAPTKEKRRTMETMGMQFATLG